MNANLKEVLQTQLNQSLPFTGCLGVNVAINDEKHGFWLGSAGFSDINATKNIDINQLFYIYSITKTFTSVCLLRLAQDGLLSLDDAVSKFLPYISFPKSVTLRRLLNHNMESNTVTVVTDQVTILGQCIYQISADVN